MSRHVGLLLLTLLIPLSAGSTLAASRRGGAVYAMTNAAAGNEVVEWVRNRKGRIALAGRFPTGGSGSGGELDPLGSQDSLLLSDDLRWLFAVNAGSDEVSVFRVRQRGLELVDRVPSGGRFPVSLAQRRDLLYVLNAGGDGAIRGFSIGGDGRLGEIPGSTRSLGLGGSNPPNVGRAPSQVGFSPDGRWLVIVDKGGNRLLTFSVDGEGRPGEEAVATPSAGRLPFAFRFVQGGFLVVAEIFGRSAKPDPAGASAVSSYVLARDGSLHSVTSSLPTGRTALCWIDASGRAAWGANTGDNTISAFRINRRGAVSLAGPGGLAHKFRSPARLPLDLGVTPDGRFLYTLNAARGTVAAFRINGNLSLTALGEAPGLSRLKGSQGIAVR